jgi:hypothetical protein
MIKTTPDSMRDIKNKNISDKRKYDVEDISYFGDDCSRLKSVVHGKRN